MSSYTRALGTNRMHQIPIKIAGERKRDKVSRKSIIIYSV